MWCAAAIVVLVPGWAAVRLLRLERHVGMSGAIPVAFGLGLAVWTVPLAVAFLFTLPFGYPLAAVLILGWGGMAYALRRPARPRGGAAGRDRRRRGRHRWRSRS